MPEEKKYTIIRIIFIILIMVLLIVLFAPNPKPTNIIKRKINLVLPDSAEIIHFNYNKWLGDFDAKIQFNVQDIEGIKKDLLAFFRQECDKENRYLPDFQNTNSWWDIDKNNIESCYSTDVEGKKILFFPSPKTKEIWAFIVKQNDGKYYLYVSYL